MTIKKHNDNWTDTLEALNALPNPPRRILLFGKPGTGKTTFAVSITPNCERITITAGMFADAIFGKFLLKNGSTFYADTAVIRAAEKGVPVVIDEIDKGGAELDAAFQSALDDAKICVLNLDDGRAIKPAAGYRVIATMNGTPDMLAPAVLDRFDVVIRCDTPAAGLLAELLPDSAQFLKNKMENEAAATGENWIPPVSPRRMLAFDAMRKQGLDETHAAVIQFGATQAPVILTALIDAQRNAAVKS